MASDNGARRRCCRCFLICQNLGGLHIGFKWKLWNLLLRFTYLYYFLEVLSSTKSGKKLHTINKCGFPENSFEFQSSYLQSSLYFTLAWITDLILVTFDGGIMLHLLRNRLPYARHYNPVLIRNCSWILTINKDRILRKKNHLNWKKWSSKMG